MGGIYVQYTQENLAKEESKTNLRFLLWFGNLAKKPEHELLSVSYLSPCC
jgi:hypothetical protein